MRRFQLVNENGQVYQLINDSSKAFLWQPSGLGFQVDKEYMESDGFFFEMNSSMGQVAKEGTLVFYGSDPYTEYNTFMNYIARSKSLKLAYAPKQIWYYVDIDIESVQKSEIELDGTLQCSISMLPKTPLYLPYEMNIKLSGDLGSSIKQYDYKYELNMKLMMPLLPANIEPNYLGETTSSIGPDEMARDIVIDGVTVTPKLGDYVRRVGSTQYFYVYLNKYNTLRWGYFSSVDIPTKEPYSYKYSNTAVAGEIEFEIPAQMNSGLEMTIFGEISAPVVTFYVGNEIIGRVDLSAISIQSGEYVKYSSIPLSAGIYLYSDGTETDITEQIGLSASIPTFFLLPPYTTIKAVMSADTITGTSASLKVYEYFKSV